MKKFLLMWAIPIVAAGVIQESLDALLPTDLPRVWVLMIGGVAALLWRALIDAPLTKIAERQVS